MSTDDVILTVCSVVLVATSAGSLWQRIREVVQAHTDAQMDSKLRIFFEAAWREFELTGGRDSSAAQAWFNSWAAGCQPSDAPWPNSHLHGGDTKEDVWKSFRGYLYMQQCWKKRYR